MGFFTLRIWHSNEFEKKKMKSPNLTITILLLAALAFLSFSMGRPEQGFEASKSETTNSKAKEGCYVWKDSLGWWNVRWLGSESKVITGQIWSRKNLVIDSGYGSLIAVWMPRPNVIYFEGPILDSLVGFWFTSSADWFDIDVRFDGKRVPDKVFFGEGCVSPRTLPIRVEDKVEPMELGRLDTAKLESTALGQKVEGFRGGKANGRIEGSTSEPIRSFPETPPGTTSHLVDKHSSSPALRLPDSLRGWPAALPPDPKDRPAGFDPDDSTSTITQVYDVATGKIRRLDEEKAKKPSE